MSLLLLKKTQNELFFISQMLGGWGIFFLKSVLDMSKISQNIDFDAFFSAFFSFCVPSELKFTTQKQQKCPIGSY